MTYTTVFKDYPAATMAEAAEKMLRDPEVWRLNRQTGEPADKAENAGYAVESWEWIVTNGSSALRVWFR